VPPDSTGALVFGEVDELEHWIDVVNRAVALAGTPCYVNRVAPVAARAAQLERGDPGVRSWLSYKTHPLPALLSWWIRGGRGVEVVSEIEFTTACQLGCTPDQLLVNGPAKHAWLGRHTLPRLRVHFDSPRELAALLPLAVRDGWRVGVRVHVPGERDGRDARFGGPFGMTSAEAIAALGQLRAAGADLQSLHFHLGQAPQHPDAFVRAIDHVAGIAEAASFAPRHLDLGGGLPAPPADAAVAGLWRGMAAARARFPDLEQIWVENGRFVTAQSAALAVRVLDVKDRPECRYLVCDGGRTNHALAADRGLHPLLLLPARSGPPRMTSICGPTCMTDDVLGRLPLPGDVVPGDVLVWMHAGAYHLPWETRFSQGLCAIVWADEGERISIARAREDVRGPQLP
jgi:diaminopimelate decarboxylase